VKYLLLTLEYPPYKGGVANYYANLSKYFPEAENFLILDNNENKLLNKKLPFGKWLPSLLSLYFEIKKKGINYVFVGHILPIGTAAWIISKITDIRYSVILHGMDINMSLKKILKKKISAKILENAHTIICANNYAKDVVEKNFKKMQNKIIVVNPGVNINHKQSHKGFENLKNKYALTDQLILFSLGRQVKRKGFDKTINAVKRINASQNNNKNSAKKIAYFIAGSGPDEDYLKNLAQGEKNIIFLGEISDEDKWLWLDFCDIFIMPARNIDGDVEGFGIVYLEANAAGKPVIAGNSGGVTDAVQNGINGLLINPESEKEIENAILKLLEDKNLRNKLGERGRERVKKNFSWHNKIKQIYQFINQPDDSRIS
jgi:phosphatidylinositol alpha-1,6-mannosyltransferase